ncbi:cell wall-binding repeat-containing protein [Microcella sp.]|uniref:cell wall-binding repeat-containing protein n=1 Tax=Microcella sp. TaxID=1913979 RepID=UPI002562F165|nr:cell wall-binding repeat-containing protein [Microcella sp.]MBX9470593.1 cell wall-binding repeat-containing protein [Microcella sp.]
MAGAALLIPAAPAQAVDDAVVQGVVTFFPGGAPVLNSTVTLFDSTNESVDTAVTNEFGAYEFVGLAAGDYKVCVDGDVASPVHADVCWDYKPTRQSSETFPVAESATETLDDIEVVTGVTISGTVTGENGPSDNWYLLVDILANNGFGTWLYSSSVFVALDATGEWSIENLQPGQYRLRYFDIGATDYRTMYHSQAKNEPGAQNIVLSNNQSESVAAEMSVLGPITVGRLSGDDRYATAVAISGEFTTANGDPGAILYIAGGTNYPDALAAAALAAKFNSPLLLTPSNSLPPAVIAEIQRFQPGQIVIAGGTGVVSATVQTQLEALAPVVRRMGGADRYATARLLVDDAFPTGFDGAFIATGRNYADALAAAASAGGLDWPVVLVDGNASSLSTTQLSWLTSSGATEFIIAGGTGSVSAGIATQLQTAFGPTSVTRLGGADRYATSLLINGTGSKTSGTAYFATGTGFADALAGAALAGARNAALFLVPPTCVPAEVLSELGPSGLDPAQVTLLGGTGVLSSRVAALTSC